MRENLEKLMPKISWNGEKPLEFQSSNPIPAAPRTPGFLGKSLDLELSQLPGNSLFPVFPKNSAPALSRISKNPLFPLENPPFPDFFPPYPPPPPHRGIFPAGIKPRNPEGIPGFPWGEERP